MNIPQAALPMYERLRAEVLSGLARPDGLTAIVYHGMLHGLALILTEIVSETSPSTAPTLTAEGVPLDQKLLRLLVNMVLESESQVTHVY
jgi:hypothetical protein